MTRHETLAGQIINKMRGGRLKDVKLLILDILSREEATYAAEVVVLKVQLEDERKKNENLVTGKD